MNDPPGSARVTRISIAPVKGLALQQLDEAELGPNGVAENRRLHLVDAAGRLVNGKVSMRLSLVASRLDLAAGTLALEFPGGQVVAGALELGEPFETVFFGRPAAGRSSSGPGPRRSPPAPGSTCGWSCRTRSARPAIAGPTRA